MKSTLLWFALSFSLIIPLVTNAEDRRMPGGSWYFRSDTISSTKQWDIEWEELNLAIHQRAEWNHAKSMALRAFLYEYCKEQSEAYLQTHWIQEKKLTPYNKYIYFQTQLYQYMQPTVAKLRVVLDDRWISFPTVLAHLQSQDEDILYFYRTLPQRYDDAVLEDTVDEITQWLRRFYAANNAYPQTLTDLITYKFITPDVKRSSKKILYRADNVPVIMPVFLQTPTVYNAQTSSYVLAYVVQHLFNSMYETVDIPSMRVALLSYDIATRRKIQKTPSRRMWNGVWWKLILSP